MTDEPDAPKSAAQFTSELCDLIVLMPDAQVDEILEFVRVLREARAIRDGAKPAAG